MPPTRSKSGGSGGDAEEAGQAAAAGASSAISRRKNERGGNNLFFLRTQKEERTSLFVFGPLFREEPSDCSDRKEDSEEGTGPRSSCRRRARELKERGKSGPTRRQTDSVRTSVK